MAKKQSERQRTDGNGGELHQTTTSDNKLTTNQLAKDEMATIEVIALKVGPIKTSSGMETVPDHFLEGAPSLLFDCVVVAPASKHAKSLAAKSSAIDWERDAFAHLIAIGFNEAALAMFEKAYVASDADEGMVDISKGTLNSFASAAKAHQPSIRAG